MITDPIQAGLASGWKTLDAATLTRDMELEADVVVIGSGAGGGVTAEILSQAGLKVAIVEEGPLVSSTDFRMRERDAYENLYQDGAGRQTSDHAITILQGRCVGGSTTVNWTASFRTPRRTLAYWKEALGLQTMDEASLAPWFARMEERLSITTWNVAPNRNNEVLRAGAEKLGHAPAVMHRNVKGCLNLGYCGMGCPVNAKQSMLVTTIPAALDKGATLVHRARVTRLVFEGDRVEACEAYGVTRSGATPSIHRLRLRAKHFVLAAGGIGSPGILLRSNAPDPHDLLGKRTFLHPTVVSAALMREPVDAFYGAPQSIYSDRFLEAPLDGPAGYKLESAPAHPMLVGGLLPGVGEEHAQWMSRFNRMQITIALLRDGFHPDSPGGRVVLRSDSTPVLDYPMTPYLWEAARRAFLTMAQVQFAAGAEAVKPVHERARTAESWDAAKKEIEALAMEPRIARVVSAHVMGGCAMGPDARGSVVDESGRHHHIENLSVHDGSVFPTSLGANPQLSIYAIAARMASGLASGLRDS
ncbi:MAG TPA: GMC family oxidoreductase [Usitatibacter sp.]|nr:GMC family oxidoreductase [Usitatibacter sp.]